MLSESAKNNLIKLSQPQLQPKETPIPYGGKAKPTVIPEYVNKAPVKVFEVGSSGTEIYGGYISEEYLQELRGRKAMKIYDMMRRSDPRIAMVLKAVKNPIKSAEWSIAVKKDVTNKVLAEKQKELIEEILFKGLKKTWKKTLHQILSMVDFGHAEIEITHKVVLKDKKFGPYIGLKSLKLIGQKTVERFNIGCDGDLESITQYSQGDVGKNVNLASDFFLHFSVDQEGDNYEGTSLLRPCYGSWLRKNSALKQESVGNQNASTPIPVMTVPAGEQNSDQYKNALLFLENYTNNLAAYLIKPQGFELTLVNNTFDSSKIRETIAAENEEIAFAFLANFLNLGANGSSGSYSMSSNLSDFFSSSLEFIADEIIETFNNQLIPQLIALNFPNAETLIELTVAGIADKAGKEFAEVMELLARGRIITPDDDLEDAMRKKYKLPPKKMDDVEVVSLTNGNNGTKISAMVQIVTSFRSGQITRDSAIEMIKAAFDVDDVRAGAIVGPEPVTPIPVPTNNNPQFAEKKTVKKEKPEVIAKRITSNGEKIKATFRDGLKPIADDIIKKVMASYNDKPESRNHFAVMNVKPAGVNAYNQALRKVFNEVAGEAYKSVTDNYNFAITKKSVNRANAKADMLTMTQLNDIEKAVYLQFGSSVDSTDSEAALEADLEGAASSALDNIDIGAEIVSAQLENETRMDFFDEIADQLDSFTFYNSDPVSEICQELEGTTFAINDPDLERYTPPLHFNCKSVMIPNMKGDKNNPTPTGLPAISEAGKKSINLAEKSFCCNH